MAEQQMPESGQQRNARIFVVLVTALAAVAIVVALLVVVRSLHRVQPEQLPSALKPEAPDTGFVIFRASTRHKVNALSVRCKLKRKALGDSITPAQDSMSRECDSAITAVLDRMAAFDTVSRGGRKVAADSITAIYNRAKLVVRAFTRSGPAGSDIRDDSLDRELNRLISE